MLKKTLSALAFCYVGACFAALDFNTATEAKLDSIKGIGPAMSSKILDERKKGSFKDWNDFTKRVKGVKGKNAVKFSEQGLTVDGAAFKDAAAAATSK